MATVFSASDFADTPAAVGSQQPTQTPAQPGPVQTFQASDFGDQLPTYANGLDKSRPINESPIDPLDRLKLSVGNEQGKLNFLKERFKAVEKTKTGDYVVQDKDGFWKRIDPEGLGSGDAWAMTKELVSDAADFIKPAVGVAAQVGAAAGLAAATGGSSLTVQGATSAAVGAAVEAGMTSLGRLAGTYDATPEEQLKDIGIEAALNLGGTYVAAGMKPALSYIGKGLAKTGEMLSKVNPVSRESTTSILGAMTGVGPKPYEVLIDNPTAVNAAIQRASGAGASSAEAIDRMGLKMVEEAATMAKSARPTATALYDNLAKEVAATVPETFNANIPKVTSAMLQPLEQQGLGVLNGAGKWVMRDADEFAKYVAENAATTGELSALAADKQSYNLLREAAEAVQSYEGAKSLTGEAGANQVMKLRRILNDTTHKLQEQATDAALVPAQRVLAQMKEASDGVIHGMFDRSEPIKSAITQAETTNLYASMNEVYNQTMRDLNPLIKAAGQAARQNSDVPFQTLANQLVSNSGRNSLQKSAADKAIELASQRSGSIGKEIADAYANLQANYAGAALMPSMRKNAISQTAAAGAVGALAAGNPLVAAGLVGTAAATSPRVSKLAVETAMKGKAMLSQLSPAQRGAFLADPQAIAQWGSTILNAPAIHQQTATGLIREAEQRINGGQ